MRVAHCFIDSNERLETSLSGVYAVGDATGGAMLTHRAMAQGRYAAENVLGTNRRLDDDAIPSCVFTVPEVATVGLTLSEAQKRGLSAQEMAFAFASRGRRCGLLQAPPQRHNALSRWPARRGGDSLR